LLLLDWLLFSPICLLSWDACFLSLRVYTGLWLLPNSMHHEKGCLLTSDWMYSWRQPKYQPTSAFLPLRYPTSGSVRSLQEALFAHQCLTCKLSITVLVPYCMLPVMTCTQCQANICGAPTIPSIWGRSVASLLAILPLQNIVTCTTLTITTCEVRHSMFRLKPKSPHVQGT
jgi:hypothetical protein